MNFQILKSYGKLNLFLTVGNLDKKKNLHNIETYVSKIRIFDNILVSSFKFPVNFIIQSSGITSENEYLLLITATAFFIKSDFITADSTG